MPSQAHMKAALQAYIDGFNSDDADAIMALFADDAVIEDPVGSPLKSRVEFEAFIRQGVKFGARLSLAAPIRGSHGNHAAMVFTVTFVQDGVRYATNSTDVMTFDDAGKIIRMEGYWGPGDVVVNEGAG
jgi:steroid Delta-isomerase